MRLHRLIAVLVFLTAYAAYASPLMFVTDVSTSTLNTYDATTGALIGTDNAGGGLGSPEGVAIGPDGNVYVADSSSGVIDRFSGTTGQFMGEFVGPSGGLTAPSGITFGSDGNLYVADYGTGGNSYVNVYDGTTGAFISQMIAPGAGAPNGGLFDPNGIAFGPGGLYISDQANGVDLFSTTGTFISVFVPLGSGPGAPAGLADPAGLVFGPNGDLFLADITSGVVDRFDSAGNFLGVFGDTNILAQPVGLAFGPDGNLYVADSNGIERFNGTTGASLGTFLQAGNGITNAQYLAFSSSSVPEPSTMALIALGGFALAALKRRG